MDNYIIVTSDIQKEITKHTSTRNIITLQSLTEKPNNILNNLLQVIVKNKNMVEDLNELFIYNCPISLGNGIKSKETNIKNYFCNYINKNNLSINTNDIKNKGVDGFKLNRIRQTNNNNNYDIKKLLIIVNIDSNLKGGSNKCSHSQSSYCLNCSGHQSTNCLNCSKQQTTNCSNCSKQQTKYFINYNN